MVEVVGKVVDKLDVEVTMITAVEIVQRHFQARQSSRVHVKHSGGIFLIAPIIAKPTDMPPLSRNYQSMSELLSRMVGMSVHPSKWKPSLQYCYHPLQLLLKTLMHQPQRNGWTNACMTRGLMHSLSMRPSSMQTSSLYILSCLGNVLISSRLNSSNRTPGQPFMMNKMVLPS